MASQTEVKYTCDNCGKALPTWGNDVIIRTKKDTWSDLRVQIQSYSSYNRLNKEAAADLCKACAITLLEDAITRIRSNERISAGVRVTQQLGFDEPF